MPERANDIKVTVGLSILGELTSATPKLTGRATWNWRAGSPAMPADAYIDLKRQWPWQSPYADNKNSIMSTRPGWAVWIINAAPYIGALEGGYSPKARSGWIARAVKRAKQLAAVMVRQRPLMGG